MDMEDKIIETGEIKIGKRLRLTEVKRKTQEAKIEHWTSGKKDALSSEGDRRHLGGGRIGRLQMLTDDAKKKG